MPRRRVRRAPGFKAPGSARFPRIARLDPDRAPAGFCFRVQVIPSGQGGNSRGRVGGGVNSQRSAAPGKPAPAPKFAKTGERARELAGVTAEMQEVRE